MTADAVGFGERAAQAAGCRELVFRVVALEDLSDLEQRGIGKAAVGIALRRHDQAGNEAWPHVGQFGGDRVGKRQCRAAAAEKLGLVFRDERPGDGLNQAARGQRAFGLAGPVLNCGEHRLAREFTARERRRRHAVDADNAHDLFDNVGAPVHIRPPRGHRHFHALVLADGKKSELFQNAARIGERQLQAGQSRQIAQAGSRRLFPWASDRRRPRLPMLRRRINRAPSVSQARGPEA